MRPEPLAAIDSPWPSAVCAEPAQHMPAALRRGVAIAAAISLNIVLAGLVTALAESRVIRSTAPPVTFTTYVQAMAYCSLIAIWWVRSRWPSHVRTLAAFSVCLGIWALMLPRQISGLDVTGVWAASLSVQALVTLIAAGVFEFLVTRSRNVLEHRFTIAFLLIWMTVIGIILALARWAWTIYEWTPQRLLGSDLFPELQVVGIANAVLTLAILACVRIPKTNSIRIAACIVAVPLLGAVATICRYLTLHGRFGPLPVEYWWLMTAQGMMIAATLLPLEVAGRANEP